MNQTIDACTAAVQAIRPIVFAIAVLVAIMAMLDWLVRTRRVQPFGVVGRFSRRVIDPLLRPIETRVIRAGGEPSKAPWWALGAVVVGGLLLITALRYVCSFVADVAWAVSTPGRLGLFLVGTALGLLQLAIIVRVIASWFRISEFSRWIRWSYVLTEWMLGPLRRMIPTLGPIDVSPIVAYILVSLVRSAIGA